MSLRQRFNVQHHPAFHDEVRELEDHGVQRGGPGRDALVADRGPDDEPRLAVSRGNQSEGAGAVLPELR